MSYKQSDEVNEEATKYYQSLLDGTDGKTSLTHKVEASIRKHYHDKVFESIIPRNVRVSKAPSYGMSVIRYAPYATGRIDKKRERIRGDRQ